MAAGAIPKDEEESRLFARMGLVEGHAYGVIGKAEVTGSDGRFA